MSGCVEMLRVTVLQPEQIDGILMSMIQQALNTAKSDMEGEKVAAAVKKKILSNEFLKKFALPIDKTFTHDEIKSMIAFYQSEAMRKFYKISPEIFLPMYTAIQGVVNDIVVPIDARKTSSDRVFSISASNYQKEVTEYKGSAILEVYSTFCGPCQAMASIFSELSNEFGDQVKFLKFNLDGEGQLAKELEIYSVPTLLLIKGGKIIDRHIGLMNKKDLSVKIKEKLF